MRNQLVFFCVPVLMLASVPAKKTEAAAAAEPGSASAQYSMALAFESGSGVPQDLEKAAYWYRKAAVQGHPQAQNNLGVLYATGQGVSRDDTQAANWYRKAAAQNHPQGMANLASMYLEGRGVKQDHAKAFDLCRQASELGSAIAQNNLALMYANGQSVRTDYVWAYAWLDVASAQLAAAGELRDRIAVEMSAEQIAEAKLRAREKRRELTAKNQ